VRESVGLADVSWMAKFDLKGYGLTTAPALGADAFWWVLGRNHGLITYEPPVVEKVMQEIQPLQTTGADLSVPLLVYLTEVTSVYAQLLLAGPHSRQVLHKLTSLNLSENSMGNLTCAQAGVAHVHAMVLRKDLTGMPAVQLLVSREYGESVWESVLHAGHEFHITPFGLEALRIVNSE